MTMNSKALAAGLAIMLAGAVVGWNASQMADAKSGPTLDKMPIAEVQEKPSGDLTPQKEYQPEPVRRTPTRSVTRPRARTTSRSTSAYRGITIPAGTPVAVTVNSALSSKTAQVGQSWSGTVAEAVYHNGREVIPAGSHVSGVVAVAQPAERGDRAKLQLSLRSISVNGRSYNVRGASEAVVAGSPRVRNIGAIAGGTAAGALIGRAVAKSTKGTLIGAAVGGGAATAAVAASKGYQATIPAGKQMSFTTGTSVTVRA
jgi:hypothetical protein